MANHKRPFGEVLGKGVMTKAEIATADQLPAAEVTKPVSTFEYPKRTAHAHRKMVQSPRLKLAKSASV